MLANRVLPRPPRLITFWTLARLLRRQRCSRRRRLAGRRDRLRLASRSFPGCRLQSRFPVNAGASIGDTVVSGGYPVRVTFYHYRIFGKSLQQASWMNEPR